jgi:hypothetical protein
MVFSFLLLFWGRSVLLRPLLYGASSVLCDNLCANSSFFIALIFAVLPLPRYSHAVPGKRLFCF